MHGKGARGSGNQSLNHVRARHSSVRRELEHRVNTWSTWVSQPKLDWRNNPRKRMEEVEGMCVPVIENARDWRRKHWSVYTGSSIAATKNAELRFRRSKSETKLIESVTNSWNCLFERRKITPLKGDGGVNVYIVGIIVRYDWKSIEVGNVKSIQ